VRPDQRRGRGGLAQPRGWAALPPLIHAGARPGGRRPALGDRGGDRCRRPKGRENALSGRMAQQEATPLGDGGPV